MEITGSKNKLPLSVDPWCRNPTHLGRQVGIQVRMGVVLVGRVGVVDLVVAGAVELVAAELVVVEQVAAEVVWIVVTLVERRVVSHNWMDQWTCESMTSVCILYIPCTHAANLKFICISVPHTEIIIVKGNHVLRDELIKKKGSKCISKHCIPWQQQNNYYTLPN